MARMKCNVCGALMETVVIGSTHAYVRCSNPACPSRRHDGEKE